MYARAGRSRTSAVMRADVAPLLLRHGLISVSHQLYQMKGHMYAREGWDMLRAHVLPQLVACLKGTDPANLMAAGLAYLSLPNEYGAEAGRLEMQMEIQSSAEYVDRDALLDQHLVTAPALQVIQ